MLIGTSESLHFTLYKVCVRLLPAPCPGSVCIRSRVPHRVALVARFWMAGCEVTIEMGDYRPIRVIPEFLA